jgi:methyl-accepting chemotaxis protein
MRRGIMRDMRIGRKLTIGFGVVIGIMAFVLILAYVNMKQVDRTFDQVMKVNVAKVGASNMVIKAIDQIFYGMAIIMMSKDAGVVEEQRNRIAQKRQEQNTGFEALQKMEQSEKGKELINEMKAMSAKGKEANNKAMELAKAGKNEEAMQVYVKEARPFAVNIFEILEKLITHQEEAMKAAHDAALKQGAFFRLLLFIFGVTAVCLGAVTAYLLNRSITVPLSEGIAIADRLARGELNMEVKVDRKDEVGKLLQSMKNMVDKWKTLISEVKSSAASVASASHEMSASAEQLSRGSAAQVERTIQVSTASEEMSQASLDIARNANSISDSAKDMLLTAENGSSIVSKSVNEVNEIAEIVNRSSELVRDLGSQSEKIGEIVLVINDIADQTNLLALNAAIEAARAGDAGRGFAVVADEVKKLAERTSKSTQEIAGMITAIKSGVEKAVTSMDEASGSVKKGVEFSGEAGSALTGIVSSASNLQSMVQQIAAAIEEMNSTTDEIAKDIEQVASVTKESSNTAEQVTQSALELSTLSVSLEHSVSEFKV